jgi:hypothetical protein
LTGRQCPRKPSTRSKALIEGTTTQGWHEALGALTIAFPDRFAGHIN